MTRRLAASIVTAAVFGALLCAAPAHAASSTSATQWANGVCSAVQTFGDSVKSTLTGLKGASSLDDATQQLESSLNDLGKPPTSDGTKAQNAVQSLSKELKNDVSDVEDLLSPPPSTPQEIASTFSQIGSEVQHAVDQVQSTATTLKGLKPNGALKKAFQNSSSCQKLKSEL